LGERWPRIGGLLIIASAILYLTGQDPDPGIYILLGVIFLLGWFLRKEIRNAQDAYWETV
jgi:hypothetical protein